MLQTRGCLAVQHPPPPLAGLGYLVSKKTRLATSLGNREVMLILCYFVIFPPLPSKGT